MPISPRKISSDLVVVLCVFENPHIHIHNRHTFCVASEPGKSSCIWNADLRQARIAFTWWTASVGKDNGYNVLCQ